MKRAARIFVALAVAGVVLLVPAVAFAPPGPITVPLATGYASGECRTYQDEQGQWWVDGAVSNFTGCGWLPWSGYSTSPANRCVVTIEYLDAANAVVGTSVQPALAYVLNTYLLEGYYSRVHVKQYPPAGAVPSKTRLADSTADQTKAYGYGWAYGPERLNAIPQGSPVVGTGGRTTYSVNVTNSKAYNLSGVIVVGNEGCWLTDPGTSEYLDTLHAGTWFIPAGDTVTGIQVKGLAATPAGYTRTAPQVWAEGVVAPDLTVYRFFNKKTGSHFYTADPNEKASIEANLGWLYQLDGAAYTDLQKLSPNRVALWRLYNKKTGTHFFTADINEKHQLMNAFPDTYQLDGEAYRVSLTPGSEPAVMTVWRFYNKKTGTHFYTADPNEKANIETTMGATYSFDGVAFYIAKS